MKPYIFDEQAAALNPDVAGPMDYTNRGEVREKDDRIMVLAYGRRSWVVVWTWYGESGIWCQGTRSVAWWSDARPCALPEGVESPC